MAEGEGTSTATPAATLETRLEGMEARLEGIMRALERSAGRPEAGGEPVGGKSGSSPSGDDELLSSAHLNQASWIGANCLCN